MTGSPGSRTGQMRQPVKESNSNMTTVCSFESRRGDDMRSLIERAGGRATIAPSMQELPIEENTDAIAFAQRLIAGEIDAVIFLTGVGARALLEAVGTRFAREEFLDALRRCTIFVRGPKPVVVLREWKTQIDYRAPEPNTWRELVKLIDDESIELSGKNVAVQEYGIASSALYEELRSRGAAVVPVPVYRWTLPDDTQPLEEAVSATIEGRFDILLFTSANQAMNVVGVTDRMGVESEWLDAANRSFIGSIGPTCTEALRSLSLQVDFEASPPKMGQLVRGSLEAFRTAEGDAAS